MEISMSSELLNAPEIQEADMAELESNAELESCSASETFIQGLAGLVNQGDVEAVIRAQKHMLQRFEKTNEMLINCNALSNTRLKAANEDFKRHVKMLTDMRKDLDYIFRKIRVIKQKLQQQYPDIYADMLPQRNSLAEEAAEMEPCTSAAAQARLSRGESSTTVEYVQMAETVDNGKPTENEIMKRVCSLETANPNDSSDCTSEDTG